MNETDESLEGWGDGKIKEKLSAVYVSIFSWKCKYGNVLITRERELLKTAVLIWHK